MARSSLGVGSATVLVLVVGAVLTPLAAADHPGSNHGLSLFIDPAAPILGEQVVHRWFDVQRSFDAWNQAHADYVELSTIGVTNLGLPLLTIRVTDESVGAEESLSMPRKQVVYLDGSHHGNEYLGTELVMYYLEDLLTKASDGEADVQRFLRETEVWATPIVNADGNLADTRKNARQVDPNRNYPYLWGGVGASDSLTDFTYHGPTELSEPETAANAGFIRQLVPDLYITMHSGVAEFYWPWGWTHDPSPDDVMFTSLEQPFEEATSGRVDAMQGSLLYLVSGVSDEWAYAELGVSSFTYEVHEDQFVPVYGEPVPEVIKDQLGGLDFIVKSVKYLGAWLEVDLTEDLELTITNNGWGNATNVSIDLGQRVLEVAAVGVGQTITMPVDALDLGKTIEVRYPALLIDSSRERVHTVPVTVDLALLEAPQEALASPAFLVTIVTLVAAAFVAMRKRA